MTKGHWASILMAIGSIGSLLASATSVNDTKFLAGLIGVVISVITALNSPQVGSTSDKSTARRP